MFALSSDTISIPFSSLQYNNFDYINDARNTTNFVILSGIVRDLKSSNSYWNFLTDSINSDTFISTSSLDTTDYGYSFIQETVNYSTSSNNFSTTSATPINTQYMGVVTNSGINFLPLKNNFNVNNDTFCPDNIKDYQRIYDDGTFIQYTIDKFPNNLSNDKTTSITIISAISLGINDLLFIGETIAGDCPANSDNIYLNTSQYLTCPLSSNSSINFKNGSLYCVWLSGSDSSNNTTWMERWVDYDNISQGDEYISSKTSKGIVDVPSAISFNTGDTFLYDRYGYNKNIKFIKNIASTSMIYLSSWSNILYNEGESIGVLKPSNSVYGTSKEKLTLDGSMFGYIPSTTDILPSADMSLSINIRTDNWDIDSTQFFGNFYNGYGYGISFETGNIENLISIPTKNGKTYTLSQRGFKVFDKDIISDLGVSAISIDYIKTDIFGNKILLDSLNNKIYKVSNDDIISSILSLPTNSVINKMEIDSNNNLYVYDITSSTISSFSDDSIFVNSYSVDNEYDNFDITTDNTIVYAMADHFLIDNFDTTVKVIGSTVYYDDSRIFHLTDKADSIKIDQDNNIVIFSSGRLVKIDTTGNIIFNLYISDAYLNNSAEISILNGNIWLIVNRTKILYIISNDGIISKRINIDNIDSLSSINIHGDFTGFDIKRKYDKVGDGIISQNNPAFKARFGLICGNNKKYISLVSPCNNITDEWINLSTSVEHTKDKTNIKLFKNGLLADSIELDGNYYINYASKSSPYIIGGFSGKIGSRNSEKVSNDKSYFKGEICDILLVDRLLSPHSIKRMAKHRYYIGWSDLIFRNPCYPITLIEEMDKFHINRYKGFKSNMFNIKIKNFTEDETLRTYIKEYIINIIDNIKPANTILKDIVFE